jgi:hypothetical protein
MLVQTRRQGGEIRRFATLAEALADAEDPLVWKISFWLETRERVRLVRERDRWVYEGLPGFGGMVEDGKWRAGAKTPRDLYEVAASLLPADLVCPKCTLTAPAANGGHCRRCGEKLVDA